MRKRLNLNKKYKGVFTIEAAVVIPIVMVIITALVFITYSYHDCQVLLGDSLITVMESVEGNDEEVITSRLRERFQKNILTLENIEITENETDGEREVVCNGKVQPYVGLVSNVLGGGINVGTKVSISNFEARSTLLKYKVLIDGASKLKQVVSND